MKSYLNYSGVAVLAHRGGSIESFENTIESFITHNRLDVNLLKLMCKYHLMEFLIYSMMKL